MTSVRSKLLLVAPLLVAPLSGCFAPSYVADAVDSESGTTAGEPMAGPSGDDDGQDSADDAVDPTQGGDTDPTTGLDDGDDDDSPVATTDGDTTSDGGRGSESDGGASETGGTGGTDDGATGTDGTETGGSDDGVTGTDDGVVAVCGDGIVEGAEECDGGGVPTGACDTDCTAVECGDGVVNVLAGEVCEPGDVFENANCDTCVVACNPGFADCDGAAGCEVALNSFANCEACGMEAVSYLMDAHQTVSMSDDELWMDDDVLAVVSGSDDYTGWAAFDLSALPDGGWPLIGFMTLHMVDEPDNPSNVPGITMQYSTANDWENGLVQPGDIESAGNLSIGQWSLTEGNYQPGAANLVQLTFGNNVAQWWPIDSQDEWLTVGVNEVHDDERSVLFWGASGSDTDPRLQIVLCQ